MKEDICNQYGEDSCEKQWTVWRSGVANHHLYQSAAAFAFLPSAVKSPSFLFLRTKGNVASLLVLLGSHIFCLFPYFYKVVAFARRYLICSCFPTFTLWSHGMKKNVKRKLAWLDVAFRGWSTWALWTAENILCSTAERQWHVTGKHSSGLAVLGGAQPRGSTTVHLWM